MHQSESFNSLSVEVGGTCGMWELPTLDDHTLDSFPPPNLPSLPPTKEIPLSIPQLFNKYYLLCLKIIGVDTAIAMICFGVSAPYMVWAAYAGNYGTLAKGAHTFPHWMVRLENTDTVIIAVCVLPYFFQCLHILFVFVDFCLQSQRIATFFISIITNKQY